MERGLTLCPQVTGLDLIKREEFSWLEVLLKREFRPLSRLLLLLGWTHCHSLGSAQRLLHTLHLQQVSGVPDRATAELRPLWLRRPQTPRRPLGADRTVWCGAAGRLPFVLLVFPSLLCVSLVF